MATLRVALVNDYPVVVRGLDAMLQPYADRVEVAGLGVRQVPNEPVDVTLYDTFAAASLMGEDGDRILGDPLAGRVLLYSWNLGPDDVRSALERGCAGVVDKSSTAAELVRAIEQTAAGRRPVVPPPAQAGGEPRQCRWPGQEAGLSMREAEVLALITQGLTNEDIGRRLNLSINTVKTYIRSAYLKAEVTRRSQAVRWGIEHGMLPGPADSVP
ncbi:helix-turn-helix transcriptional regulator [Ornithinimicrobium pekingense]|uniref:DNA-binding response regulator n=1 Tax=Ornithinimicrobium pekingense TaxID=384677 RepID=A0ABQ2F3X1_9MICO|nr:response regulator transcription factor [Ornithinimicrobium pekingense]GGK56060.1 DNA-binding response regulator [Ornithinimicrobium pekingense]